jgi:hypothetical protein
MRKNSLNESLLREYIREAMKGSRGPVLDSSSSHQLVVERFEREVDVLLSEGVLDVIRTAYETVGGGIVRLKDKISSVALSAMEKVNDVFLGLMGQAFEAAKKAPQVALDLCRSIVGKIQSFKQTHPLLFKIITILLLVVLIFAVMSMFGSEAHASISVKGKMIDEQTYLEMRGSLLDHMDKVDALDIDKKLSLGQMVKQMDAAHKSSSVVEVDKLKDLGGRYISKAFEIVSDVINTSSQGGTEGGAASELLGKWLKLGKFTTFH